MVIVTGLGVLAIFAILALLCEPWDARTGSLDPRDNASIWMFIGRR